MFSFIFSNGGYIKAKAEFENLGIIDIGLTVYRNKIYLLSNEQSFDGNTGPRKRIFSFSYEGEDNVPVDSRLSDLYVMGTLRFGSRRRFMSIKSVQNIPNSEEKDIVFTADENGGTLLSTNSIKELQLINPNYTKRAIYVGKNVYHKSHSDEWTMNKPLKNDGDHLFGIELEVAGKDMQSYCMLTSIKSNYFFMENDSSL